MTRQARMVLREPAHRVTQRAGNRYRGAVEEVLVISLKKWCPLYYSGQTWCFPPFGQGFGQLEAILQEATRCLAPVHRGFTKLGITEIKMLQYPSGCSILCVSAMVAH